MGDRFRVFGELDLASLDNLQKSLTGVPAVDEYLIRGRVLNAVKDVQGETPIVPEMDWSYFDKNGFIKYEHDPVEVVVEQGKKVIAKSIPDPTNIIGAPLRRTRKGDKEEYIEAALFPGMEKAQHVVRLLGELRKHNAKYPHAKRTLGFSIEGAYLKKDTRGGRYTGRVDNVAITPNPVDVTTYLEQAEVANRAMAKSLCAGYETDTAKKTDGGALRKESLEGATHSSSKTSSGESKKMDNFKTRREAYQHYIKAGKKPDEAKQLAEQWFTERTNKRTESVTSIEKSVTNALSSFQKAIDGLAAFAGILEKSNATVVERHLALQKSLTPTGESQEIDGVKFMSTVAETVEANDKTNREGQAELAKSIVAIASGLGEVVSLVKSVLTLAGETREATDETMERVTSLMFGLRKSTEGVTTDKKVLAGLEADATGTETAKDDKSEILKSIPAKAAESYFVNAAIAATGEERKNLFDAQQVVAALGVSGLTKTYQDQLVKHFASAKN
jgi:hypothetical protein